MHILHARDFAVQPWKNGGGMTTEIAAHPAGAGFDTFEWRISMARVAVAGPFSMFPGIDRSLALIEGAGITLDVEGRGSIELAPGSHPAVFPGDVPVSATLKDGPIVDLNVMTRRGRWRHLLSRAEGSFTLKPMGHATFALATGAGFSTPVGVVSGGDVIELAADEKATNITQPRGQPAWIIDLWPI